MVILSKIVTVPWGDFMSTDKYVDAPKLGRTKESKDGTRKLRSGLVSTLSTVATCTAVVVVTYALSHIFITSFDNGAVFGGDAVAAFAPMASGVADPNPDGWAVLTKKVLWITDYLMDGVIVFAGLSWMFGHRTKAIELLISSGIGYVIVRHHEDIRNFFLML